MPLTAQHRWPPAPWPGRPLSAASPVLGRRTGGLILLIVILSCAFVAMPAAAQEEPSGVSYITPFPEGDIYKLQAYGDPFAEGLLGGLIESFAGDTRVQVAGRHRTINGIARAEIEEDLRVEEASRDTFHIGVIMIGCPTQ